MNVNSKKGTGLALCEVRYHKRGVAPKYRTIRTTLPMGVRKQVKRAYGMAKVRKSSRFFLSRNPKNHKPHSSGVGVVTKSFI
jgi:hypothetical protein